jgi:hypothetical protein
MAGRPDNDRLDRIVASMVLGLLLAGVGTLGWLLGHIATYDTLAQSHAHAHAGHEYMAPVQHGGTGLALVGLFVAFVALLAGQGPLRRWAAEWRTSRRRGPWIAASLLPASAFLVVEHAEGSIADRGIELLLVGVPLQMLLGVLALGIVRALLAVLVGVVDGLVADRSPRGTRASGVVTRHSRPTTRRRSRPMACNAALRAPPCPSS